MYEQFKAILESNPGTRYVPDHEIPIEWIERAEAYLGITFPPSYRWWLLHYGSGSLGDQSIYTLLQMDFADACGPDIVYHLITDRANGLAAANELKIFEPESADEFYYFDLSKRYPNGEYPIYCKDLEQDTSELFAESFEKFLYKKVSAIIS